MTKRFEFEKLKMPNPDICSFWEIFNFSNSIFFYHFCLPIEKIFFSQSKYTFVLPKTQSWDDSVNREEDIL